MWKSKLIIDYLKQNGLDPSHLSRILRKLSEKYPILYEIPIDVALRGDFSLPQEIDEALHKTLEIYGKYILSLPIKIPRKVNEDEISNIFDLFEEGTQIKSIIKLVIKSVMNDKRVFERMCFYLKTASFTILSKIEIRDKDVEIHADATECHKLLPMIVSLILRVYIENYGKEEGLRAFMNSLGRELEVLRKVLIKLKLIDAILGGTFEKICVPRIKNIENLIKAGHLSMGDIILIKYKLEEENDKPTYEFVKAIVEDILMRFGIVILLASPKSKIIEIIPESTIVRKIDEAFEYSYFPTKIIIIEDMSEIFSGSTSEEIRSYLQKLEEKEFLVVVVANVEKDINFLPLFEHIADYIIEISKKGDSPYVYGEKGTSRESFNLIIEEEYRTLRKIKAKKREESIDEKLRNILKRDYGVSIRAVEKIFAVRLPCESINMVTDEHIHHLDRIIRERMINLSEFMTIYIIFDEGYIEIDGKGLENILKSKSSYRLRRHAEREIVIERDRILREILDEMTSEGTKLLTGVRRGGRFGTVESTLGRGKVVGYRRASEDDLKNPSSIAILPTIKTIALRRGGIGPLSLELQNIRSSDFQVKIRKTRTQTLLCLVVDVSKYEEAEIRKKIIISLVTSVLKDAYERRDQVALVVFQGNRARILSDFTSDVEYVGKMLRDVEFGGLTPLASGIVTGYNLLRQRIGDKPSVIPIMTIFSTGSANVPLYPGGDIRRELTSICKNIRQSTVLTLFVDISRNGSLLVKDLASMTGGRYYHPPSITYFYRYLT